MGLPFTNDFYALFTRWICKTNAADLGKIPTFGASDYQFLALVRE